MGVKGIRRGMAVLLLALALWGLRQAVEAGSGVQITYSPDGWAFTTNSGETSTIWYEEGTTVRIQRDHVPAVPGVGEHLYNWKRTGEIPVAFWKVVHPYGKCIHNTYNQPGYFHGVPYNIEKCIRNYYSGWVPYCGDCGERAADFLFYMSADTAGGIQSLRTGTGYYYLCPWCSNLEQAREITPHICLAVSANRYKVVYDRNGGSGYMLPSMHMYHDISVYEGREVTPQTTLSRCGFQRVGYRFSGWNTRPDGTGQAFADGERIRDLSDQEGGQVVLYAQWSRTESALCIDPAGGSYRNNREITVLPGDYGSVCQLDMEKLVPPQGCRVSFDTRGGEPVDSIVSGQLFREWSVTMPFYGKLQDNTYLYLGDDGTEDRITALYTMQSIVLPEAHRRDQSFGGWFYDADCTSPAGAAGDHFTPLEDITLYAGWVELRLQSQENYSANRGEGAVDLSWSQRDNAGKNYKLYQRREGADWQQISSATDIGAGPSVSRNIACSGQEGSYRVPYTGFYRLTLTGAQGGEYGGFQGGKGGLAEGIFYLSQGELLQYVLGGQNGYHGGGSATLYGGGGGYSELSSDRQGLLLIAGGGGGATPMQAGMPGGSAQMNVDGRDGQQGMAGGGGGYRGGSGGSWTVHRHNGNCRHIHKGDAVNGGGCYTEEFICGSVSFRQEKKGSVFYYGNRDGEGKLCYCVRCGSYSCSGHTNYFYRNICNACGKDYDENKPSVCSALRGYMPGCGRDEEYVCGMQEGQVLSSRPAYGGSNYINTDRCGSHTQQAGYQSGNGSLQIASVALGYLEHNLLVGVVARDMGKPEKIDSDTLRLVGIQENQVRVSFLKPQDTGTVYYHKAESYALGSDRRICSSNITADTLTSQVQGYRYVVDNHEGTTVKAAHLWCGDISERPALTITMEGEAQYLHIAAQDKAGNLGETTHILLSDQTVIAWPVRTEQIALAQADCLWPAGEENTWYVRAGEDALFELSFPGILCGPARKDYQVTHLYVAALDLSGGKEEGRLGTVTPLDGALTPGSHTYTAQQLQKVTEGIPCIRDGGYTVTRRSNRCRDLEIKEKLFMPESVDGHRIRLTPIAAASEGTEMVFSDYVQDLLGSVWLVADAKPPEIAGMEVLEGTDVLEAWEEGPVEVELTASDQGSGLAEFYVEIYNQDNGSSQKYEDGGTGRIQLTLREGDALFSGAFTVIAHAVDHVGNEAVVSSQMQGISLHVNLERILEPHDPVFKAGESGILTVLTTGYVDRVEVIFPEEMTELDASLNRIWLYEVPEYVKEEKLSFMIPLRVPETVMDITVRAYKQDTGIEQRPRLATVTVKGNVLDELRTRLKLRKTEGDT